MFLQVCVILFTGGGVPDQVPPQDQVHPPRTRYPPPGTRYTPPGPGTPPRVPPRDQVHSQGQVPPFPGPGTPGTPPLGPGTPSPTRYTPPGPGGTRYTPPDQGDTVYVRAVRILLECILVKFAIVWVEKPKKKLLGSILKTLRGNYQHCRNTKQLKKFTAGR